MKKPAIVSSRELRQHLSLYLQVIEKKKMHFIIFRYTEIAAHLMPPQKQKSEKERREAMEREIRLAEEQFARGEYYTTEEARKMLGLPAGCSSGRRKSSKR